MPEEDYTFTELTYTNLTRAEVSPLAVLHVLYGAGRRIRHHIGGSLRIAAPDQEGKWLAVALVECADDRYIVSGARYLTEDEASHLAGILGWEKG